MTTSTHRNTNLANFLPTDSFRVNCTQGVPPYTQNSLIAKPLRVTRFLKLMGLHISV
jgi:hypothetical protein